MSSAFTSENMMLLSARCMEGGGLSGVVCEPEKLEVLSSSLCTRTGMLFA
jgi:hypothetical protein